MSQSLYTIRSILKRDYIPSKGENQVSDWPHQHNKNSICITHYVGSENKVK